MKYYKMICLLLISLCSNASATNTGLSNIKEKMDSLDFRFKETGELLITQGDKHHLEIDSAVQEINFVLERLASKVRDEDKSYLISKEDLIIVSIGFEFTITLDKYEYEFEYNFKNNNEVVIRSIKTFNKLPLFQVSQTFTLLPKTHCLECLQEVEFISYKKSKFEDYVLVKEITAASNLGFLEKEILIENKSYCPSSAFKTDIAGRESEFCFSSTDMPLLKIKYHDQQFMPETNCYKALFRMFALNNEDEDLQAVEFGYGEVFVSEGGGAPLALLVEIEGHSSMVTFTVSREEWKTTELALSPSQAISFLVEGFGESFTNDDTSRYFLKVDKPINQKITAEYFNLLQEIKNDIGFTYLAVGKTLWQKKNLTTLPLTAAPLPEHQKYLNSSRYINPNHPKIVEIVAKIQSKNPKTRIEVVEEILIVLQSFIFLDRNFIDGGVNKLLTTEEILMLNRGSCHHFSSLFTAIARKAGIPARIIIGSHYSCSDSDDEKNKGGFHHGYHAWVEVNLNNNEKEWIALEPQIPRFQPLPANGYIGYNLMLPYEEGNLCHSLLECSLSIAQQLNGKSIHIYNDE
ncbi:MAG: transglutaminase family protein [Silvanigrellaceae bacterium]|nr:transglutaminase family protein [Silvanigrellaceae bacterium]